MHGTLWPTEKPSRSRKTLARLARHRGDGRTVRVVASNARDEGVAVARSKEFDPNVGFGRVDEKDRPLREILKVWPYRTARPARNWWGAAGTSGRRRSVQPVFSQSFRMARLMKLDG